MGPQLKTPEKEDAPLLAMGCGASIFAIPALVLEGRLANALSRLIPAGLVLTGGGSLLPRIADSCRARFRLPVRTGTVPPSIPVRDLAAEVRSPEFATISGLLLWGLEAHRPVQPAEGQARPEPARGWIRSLRTVVAGFLPG